MKKITMITLTILLTSFSLSAAHADSWERQKQIIGPNGGQWNFNGKGNCYGGSCQSSQNWTGPGGRSVTREGYTNCANGRCEGGAKWTGPRGKTWTTKRRFKRY